MDPGGGGHSCCGRTTGARWNRGTDQRGDHVRAVVGPTGDRERRRPIGGESRGTGRRKSEYARADVSARNLGARTAPHLTAGHDTPGDQPTPTTAHDRWELTVTLDAKTWWYVTRASGFVSWSLLAVAVLWGLFLTNKTLTKTAAPAWVLDLHRHLGGLAVVFVAIHVGALPLDSFTHWSWQDLAIPMATTWHPGAIACGIVATYLLIAIEVTSLLGRRFPKKWWRRIHMLSFPLYVIASIHLFTAGTDSGNVVAQWLVVTVSTLIVFLAGVRGLAAAKPRETANPRVAAAKRAAAIAANGSGDAAPAERPAEPPSAPAPPVAVADDLLPFVHAASAPAPLPPVAAAARPALQTPTLEERVGRIRAATDAAVQRAEPDRQAVPVGAPSSRAGRA